MSSQTKAISLIFALVFFIFVNECEAGGSQNSLNRVNQQQSTVARNDLTLTSGGSGYLLEDQDPNAIPGFFPEALAEWEFQSGLGHPIGNPELPWQVRMSSMQVLEHNGLWYSIFVGMGESSRDQNAQRRISVATSQNGLSDWTQHIDQTVLEFEGTIRDQDFGAMAPAIGIHPDGSLAKHNNQWIMLFANYDGVNSHIQWATSEDGLRYDQRGDTALDTGPEGSEDQGEIWPSNLIRDENGTWYLFYHGGGDGARSIGVATGSDPKNLTPYNENRAILEATESWEGGAVHQAHILKDQEGYVMLYLNKDKDKIGIARSSDLLNWQKQGIYLSNSFKAFGNITAADNGDGTLNLRSFGKMPDSAGGYGVLSIDIEKLDYEAPPIDELVQNIQVASGRNYRVGSMEIGQNVYIDRNYEFVDFSTQLENKVLIQTANDDKTSDPSDSDFLSFDITKDAWVYVLYHPEGTQLTRSWLNVRKGWESTSDFALTTDSSSEFEVKRKLYFAGERVELGGNGSTSGASMYSVVVLALDENQLPRLSGVDHYNISVNESLAFRLDYEDVDGPGPIQIFLGDTTHLHGNLFLLSSQSSGPFGGFYKVLFIPEANFTGRAELHFQVRDGIGESEPFVITVDVGAE